MARIWPAARCACLVAPGFAVAHLACAREMASGHALALREGRLSLRDQRRESSRDPRRCMGRPAGAVALSLRARRGNTLAGAEHAGERAQPAQVSCQSALAPQASQSSWAGLTGAFSSSNTMRLVQRSVVY